MKRRAIVFDLFHTLVDTEHLRPARFDSVTEVAKVIGADRDNFATFWEATYVERESTMLDLGDLTRRYCDAAGLPLGDDDLGTIDTIDTIFGVCKDRALLDPPEGIVDLVASLASQVHVGVLSNCHLREVREWERSPLAPHVEVFGRSCEIGVMKPDPSSYHSVLDALGVQPSDATYVGNGSSDELGGARRVGFGCVVHCNIFDSRGGVVSIAAQRERAAIGDHSVVSIDELRTVLGVGASS